eukprot:CAMPEP_0114995284 /NCGR_PEP_ID=MMETSP0216-20121206/13639_1 /TAXON_ID=223996 /ORGANISM="Protocruzia adherens, Strain Boccale" /LENGTH=371 /DNA_ID=CAMNT_0002359299 /DNA_START=78 /DNA_END=1190 /DNA_ORIENTATION=-
MHFTFTPDSQWLVSTNSDKILQRWNLHTGEKQVLSTKTKFRYLIATPDNKYVLAFTDEDSKTIQKWNLATNLCDMTIDCQLFNPETATISDDGDWLIAYSVVEIGRWNIRTGQEEFLPMVGSVKQAIITNDGSWVLGILSTGKFARWGLRRTSLLTPTDQLISALPAHLDGLSYFALLDDYEAIKGSNFVSVPVNSYLPINAIQIAARKLSRKIVTFLLQSAVARDLSVGSIENAAETVLDVLHNLPTLPSIATFMDSRLITLDNINIAKAHVDDDVILTSPHPLGTSKLYLDSNNFETLFNAQSSVMWSSSKQNNVARDVEVTIIDLGGINKMEFLETLSVLPASSPVLETDVVTNVLEIMWANFGARVH